MSVVEMERSGCPSTPRCQIASVAKTSLPQAITAPKPASSIPVRFAATRRMKPAASIAPAARRGCAPFFSARLKNSSAASAEMAIRSTARGHPPIQTIATASGIPTSATRTRCVISDAPFRAGGAPGSAGRDTSEAPLALLVVTDGAEERLPVEVRPEDGGDVQLRVGDLPEHEVGDAVLAGGTDEEVGVGDGGGGELG